MPTTERFIAVDMETTGIDTATTDILEVGLVLLDANFHEIDRECVVFAVTEDILSAMEPEARAMHEASGLLSDCVTNGMDRHAAHQRVGEILDRWSDGYGAGRQARFALAGSGIAHFDALLIQREWPDFFARLPYWLGLDVSYVRRLDEQANNGRRSEINEGKTHRALDDLDCHIAEMKLYRDLFRTS